MNNYKKIKRANVKTNVGATLFAGSWISFVVGAVMMLLGSVGAGFTVVLVSLLCVYGSVAIIQDAETQLKIVPVDLELDKLK